MSVVSYSISFILDSFFFFNDTATTEIYTLSLHDALPIHGSVRLGRIEVRGFHQRYFAPVPNALGRRSEEHTSELQSLAYLVCRLLLEKKKKKIKNHTFIKKKKKKKKTQNNTQPT